MIRLYTIGFTGKSAEKFFQLLEHNQVKKIIDTRVNNNSQLSGFAKGKDLAFFAKQLTNRTSTQICTIERIVRTIQEERDFLGRIC